MFEKLAHLTSAYKLCYGITFGNTQSSSSQVVREQEKFENIQAMGYWLAEWQCPINC